MSSTTDQRHRTICDRCGKKKTTYSDGEGEGKVPDGWAELTIKLWENGAPDSLTGNEEHFAEICPKCQKDCGIQFHCAGAFE